MSRDQSLGLTIPNVNSICSSCFKGKAVQIAWILSQEIDLRITAKKVLETRLVDKKSLDRIIEKRGSKYNLNGCQLTYRKKCVSFI